MRRLAFYIILEILPLFALANLFFIAVLITEQFIQFADMVFIRNVDILSLLQTILYLLPSLFSITIPISVLLSVLLAFNRLSADSELTAFRSLGAGTVHLILPVIVFGVLSTAFAIYFNVVLVPKGGSLALNKLNTMLENISINGLKEKEMFSDLEKIIIYANKKLNNNNFEQLIVINTEDKSIITAEKGSINPAANKSLMMRFEGGRYTLADTGFTNIQFGSMTINVPLNLEIEKMPSGERFAGLEELRRNFDNGKYRFEYWKRFSLPVSTLIMALFGFRLGLFLNRSQSRGVVLSLIVALFFNALFIAGENLSVSSGASPVLLAWLPNIIFSLLVFFIFKIRY
jgi:lipopolysaccharide export system permease protein